MTRQSPVWYHEGTLAHMLAKRAEHIAYAQVLIAKFVMLVQSMMMPGIHAQSACNTSYGSLHCSRHSAENPAVSTSIDTG